MAFTDKTWAFQEGLTSANFNLVIRDNFRHLLEYRKMKATDEIVNNSAVLQNDEDFFFTVAANEKWGGEYVFRLDTTTAADFKYNFTVPAGTTYRSALIYSIPATTTDWISTDQTPAGATSAEQYLLLKAFFIVGGTPGTVQFQWAQATATAVNTIVKTGSYMIASKMN